RGAPPPGATGGGAPRVQGGTPGSGGRPPPHELAELPGRYQIVARVDQDRVGRYGVLECDHVGRAGPYRVQQQPECGQDRRRWLGGVGEQVQLTHSAATSAPYRVWRTTLHQRSAEGPEAAPPGADVSEDSRRANGNCALLASAEAPSRPARG